MAAATRPASLVWLLAVSVVTTDDHYRGASRMLRPWLAPHHSFCRCAGWPAGGDLPGGMPPDRPAVSEVLMVFVVAALPCAEMGEALDELDGLDPLDHLEAQLEFVSQPERGAVQLVERLAVHLVGEDGQVVAHVRDLVSVVVQPALGAL